MLNIDNDYNYNDDDNGNDLGKSHDDDEETFEYDDGDEHVIWQNM